MMASSAEYQSRVQVHKAGHLLTCHILSSDIQVHFDLWLFGGIYLDTLIKIKYLIS